MSIKAYIVEGNEGVCLNAETRGALGIQVGHEIVINDHNLEVEKPLASVSKIMRLVHQITGDKYAISMSRVVASEVGVSFGSIVTVSIPDEDTDEDEDTEDNEDSSNDDYNLISVEGTLREKLSHLEIGDAVRVTESQANSGAYSVARKIGIRVSKVDSDIVKRIS